MQNYFVKVFLNQKSISINLKDNKLIVKLTAKAENFAANDQLILILNKYFNSSVFIIRGHKSRNKYILVK